LSPSAASRRRQQLLWLNPRPLGPRRLEAAASPGRGVGTDEVVVDCRLEDLREPSDRLVYRVVAEAANGQELAPLLRPCALAIERRTLPRSFTVL
jgi:hypothetical protein